MFEYTWEIVLGGWTILILACELWRRRAARKITERDCY